jgi:type III restriction enzyme
MEQQPYQVTHSESRSAVSSPKTLFNLVPCNHGLEVAFSKFVGGFPDVIAFAKSAGPQSLRIDYLSGGTPLAFYTPDFFVHGSDNNYCLVETKGRADQNVSSKARAAVGWCKAASSKTAKWNYVYVPLHHARHYCSCGVHGVSCTLAISVPHITTSPLTKQLRTASLAACKEIL